MGIEHHEDIDNPNDKPQVVQHTKTADDDLDLDPEMRDLIAKFVDMSDQSKATEQKEKAMGLMEGLRTFPLAAFWSFVLSSTIIMEGYDTNLLNSFYSFPAFQKKYGKDYGGDTGYQIPAKWQTALSMAVNVGEIIGLFLAGIIADRIGYRYTIIGSLILAIGFIFIIFFSINIQMLLAGEILMGVPWGAFQTLCITYASDVCPLALRLYLTTWANCCWVIGQLISSGVLRAYVDSNAVHAYRIPFALQWMWPVPIIIGTYLAPESPYWLLRKGRKEEAKLSVARLITENKSLHHKEAFVDALVNKMEFTLQEEAISEADANYLQCFKGSNLRRTAIASMVWTMQNCTGSALMGYSTYFYEQAGLSTNMAFTFSIIQYVLGLLGTLASWLVSQKLGRFDIYFGGLIILFCLLFIVGCLGIKPTSSSGWGVGSLLLVYTFVYDSSIGPICYCIVAELPSVRLRNKTVAIARNAYNISGIVIAVISPYMLNPTAWNWKAKTGFFWSGFAFVSVFLTWFFLPETKGRTFAELDQLFESNVRARQFKHTEADVFNADRLIARMGDDGVKMFVEENKVEEKYDSESA
ncbi:maltose permease Mal31p [[Candida] railenensis]|uniref:Maltose permease Mal31p n=1 Tax=[Candida] railenensis TaxID=45579 RepID=A0A9P0QKV8_9ASCO|nr:maltose permease Mal31p [[Candida] railenensis]